MLVNASESRLERFCVCLGIITYLDTVKSLKSAYSAFYDIDTHHRFMFFVIFAIPFRGFFGCMAL